MIRIPYSIANVVQTDGVVRMWSHVVACGRMWSHVLGVQHNHNQQ